MAFKVQIVAAAQRDITETTDFIAEDSPTLARKWLLGLASITRTLTEMPLRFAVIPESEELKRTLRSFPYHSHRVVYEVDEVRQIVSILRVYHTSRAPLGFDDFDELA